MIYPRGIRRIDNEGGSAANDGLLAFRIIAVYRRSINSDATDGAPYDALLPPPPPLALLLFDRIRSIDRSIARARSRVSLWINRGASRGLRNHLTIDGAPPLPVVNAPIKCTGFDDAIARVAAFYQLEMWDACTVRRYQFVRREYGSSTFAYSRIRIGPLASLVLSKLQRDKSRRTPKETGNTIVDKIMHEKATGRSERRETRSRAHTVD